MTPIDRPCRYCAHWLRWDASRAAVCGLGGRVQVVAQPERGCAFWTREPGADDDVARAVDLDVGRSPYRL